MHAPEGRATDNVLFDTHLNGFEGGMSHVPGITTLV